jgi:hypothetical protein
MQAGERVGAVLGASKGSENIKSVVRFLGYGIYLGCEVNPDIGISNPKIQLDNGNIVWGFQCWWGSEDKIKEQLSLYDVIKYVDINGDVIND